MNIYIWVMEGKNILVSCFSLLVSLTVDPRPEACRCTDLHLGALGVWVDTLWAAKVRYVSTLLRVMNYEM